MSRARAHDPITGIIDNRRHGDCLSCDAVRAGLGEGQGAKMPEPNGESAGHCPDIHKVVDRLLSAGTRGRMTETGVFLPSPQKRFALTRWHRKET